MFLHTIILKLSHFIFLERLDFGVFYSLFALCPIAPNNKVSLAIYLNHISFYIALVSFPRSLAI